MINIDTVYLSWLIACHEVQLKDDLAKQQNILDELQESEPTKVIIESIARQKESIAYTQSEIDKLNDFKTQFKKSLTEYHIVALEYDEFESVKSTIK